MGGESKVAEERKQDVTTATTKPKDNTHETQHCKERKCSRRKTNNENESDDSDDDSTNVDY